MSPEQVGVVCAPILAVAAVAALAVNAEHVAALPRVEALYVLALVYLARLWHLHASAQRAPSTLGDSHWRDAVKERLPEMVRNAKVWGRQLAGADSEDEAMGAVLVMGEFSRHPWGVQVPIWPPDGGNVLLLQNGADRMLSALARPMADAHEPLALVDPIEDPYQPGRCLLRVLPTDPFAHPIEWHWPEDDGPMGSRLGSPIAGFDRYATPVKLPGVGRSLLMAGVPRSGKSTGMVAHLRQWFPTQAAIVGIDTAGYGVDLLPLRPRLAGLYTKHADVLPVLRSLLAERDARLPAMVANGMLKLETDEQFHQLAHILGRPCPPIILAIDEAHDAFPLKSEETETLKRLIKEAAKVGIWVLFATQRMSHQEMDTTLRGLFAAGCCYKVANATDAGMALGGLPPGLEVGPWTIKSNQRGMHYVKAEETDGGAISAGGLIAVRSVQLEVGSKRDPYPEVTRSAKATAHRAPALPFLPTPT